VLFVGEGWLKRGKSLSGKARCGVPGWAPRATRDFVARNGLSLMERGNLVVLIYRKHTSSLLKDRNDVVV
jgi:hypothetical protein